MGDLTENFSTNEFSEDIMAHAAPGLVVKLQQTRDLLGAAIYPSSAPGALARFGYQDRRSRHYAVDRKSTAIDWFTDADPLDTWTAIHRSRLWKGVGIYFDTKPSVMFHTDFMRVKPAVWLRRGGVYTWGSEGDVFWRRLRAELSA